MKIRNIITVILSLFVSISLIYLFMNKTGLKQDSKNEEKNINEEKVNNDVRNIIVYYFFTNYRCKTCYNIENYTAEAIKTGFGKEITSGKVIWKPVNMDETVNDHFKKEFKLYTKSVIVEEKAGERRLQWKNLEKIWEYVNDKEVFIRYIQDEIKKYLGRV